MQNPGCAARVPVGPRFFIDGRPLRVAQSAARREPWVMEDGWPRFVSFIGLFAMMGIAWALGENRRRVNLRTVVAGLLACFMTACYAGMLV
jgi:hypothetical protein